MLSSRKFVGIIILIIAILLLGNNLGVWESSGIFSTYWPVIIIAFGLYFLINNKNKVFGTVLLIIGILFQARELKFLSEFNLGDFVWPVIIALIALSLIFSNDRKKFSINCDDDEEDDF